MRIKNIYVVFILLFLFQVTERQRTVFIFRDQKPQMGTFPKFTGSKYDKIYRWFHWTRGLPLTSGLCLFIGLASMY